MYKNLLFIAFCITLIFSACGDQKTVGVTESGYTYYMYTNVNGEKPEEGDKIKFYERVTLGVDSVLVEQIREAVLPLRADVTGPNPNYELMFLLSAGDSASIWVSGKDMEAYGLNPADTLYFHIGFKEIIARRAEVELEKEAQAADRRQLHEEMKARETAVAAMAAQTLEDYKKGTLNPVIQKTASGLKYILHDQGSDPEVEKLNNLDVHYYGMLVYDGKMFDNSFSRGQPFTFTVGIGQVIPGWDEGLQYLRKGSKATFFIPSKLAYGEQGNQGIPPNSELLFYVEVMDVRN